MTKKKEKENHAGRLGDLTVDGLTFGVRVTEGPRGAYGRLDYQISPIDGSGEAWVNAGRVKLRPEPEKEFRHWDSENQIWVYPDHPEQKPAEEKPTRSLENEEAA